jgi:dihydrofolate reductase
MTMVSSIIVAAASNGAIGGDNKMLWHMPTDMKYFKNMTTNHTVIMGRKSYDALGKPLPNRVNIVISKNENYELNGCYTVTSLEQAFNLAQELYANNDETTEQQIFVIGGAQIYKLAMPIVDKLYVTEIKGVFDGDAFFDKVDLSIWEEIARDSHQKDEKNKYDYDFVVYERKK